MTAKEYLQQIYLLDQTVNINLDELQRLRDLSVKANATISDMPGSATRNTQKMESAIVKMVDLEMKIDGEIDKLVDLKTKIRGEISEMPDVRYRFLLQARYINLMSWDTIANDMALCKRQVLRLHSEALQEFDKVVTKCRD